MAFYFICSLARGSSRLSFKKDKFLHFLLLLIFFRPPPRVLPIRWLSCACRARPRGERTSFASRSAVSLRKNSNYISKVALRQAQGRRARAPTHSPRHLYRLAFGLVKSRFEHTKKLRSIFQCKENAKI